MKRLRWIPAVLAVAPLACADHRPGRVSSVAIAATPCDRPTARLGVGTLVADGWVLTAAHVVEDDLRDVAVDGQPARVVALDSDIDVAILSVDMPVDGDPVGGISAILAAADIADAVRIITPTDVIETTVERIVTLAVDDTTDGAVRRRLALVLDGAVPGGTSGAPVVGDDGHVVGMVTISHPGRDVTYATSSAEIQALMDSDLAGRAVTKSSLAASDACA